MKDNIENTTEAETIYITVPPKRKDGERVDKYLSRAIHQVSRSQLQQLIDDHQVLVNENPVKQSYSISPGDEIRVTIPEKPSLEIEPEPIPLDIIYEDARMIAVNKEPDIVVHPGVGNSTGTLVNALLHHTEKLAETDSEIRPGLVHRLDKETSGVLLVAKDEETHRRLSRQFEDRVVEKEYRAWVWGRPKRSTGTIRKAIGRHPRDRKKFAPQPQGKRAVTHYEVLEDHDITSLLQLRIETGRTHQIRVHCTSMGHPVIGDSMYNGRSKRLKSLAVSDRKWGARLLEILNRQALHAFRIGFNHPWTGKWMELEAPLPEDFIKAHELMEERKRVLFQA
ncbi:MAG: RluA family pseudouridine synthase [Candidatus Marinimicrobia bacterium]|nr:RluA family pseudouridine synthase [Candidatus Neomarinimicrobiota bacterium]MCF7830077.1 RluA family pseudouridine synthase [Candidatus Neomarinimicrobiota bacterium]MCF7882124.1 RluA family pseudouridine synthase [Candidatus Neomarinimicrobiota bacterium]